MKLAPLSRETLISLPTLFTPRIFKLWRCFLLLFAVEVVALEFYNCPRKLHERLRFLTVWGYLMNLAAQSALFIATHTNPQLPAKEWVSPAWKAALLLYELAFSMQFPITIVYWVAIFPSDQEIDSPFQHFRNLQVHLCLLVFYLCDFFMSGVYFNKAHAKWVAALTLAYLAFNMACTFLDRPVYPVINWRDRLSFVFGGVAVTLCVSAFQIFSSVSSRRFKALSFRLKALHKEAALLAKQHVA